MARFAVVRDEDQVVVNMIEYDGKAKFHPPVGHFIMPAVDTANIGDTWTGSEFLTPAEVAERA